MILDKIAILEEMKLKTETVPFNAGDVIVSEIGAEDYIKLWLDLRYQDDNGNMDMAKLTPALVAYSVVDASGNRIFSEDDIQTLARAAHGPFNILAKSARRINGLAGDEIKNSEPSLTESSSSDSV